MANLNLWMAQSEVLCMCERACESVSVSLPETHDHAGSIARARTHKQDF
jgi:hypothetical protein